MFRLAAACEGLDDDHAAAAASTWTRQHAGFVGGCRLGRLGRFRAGRDGEQLARSCDVGDAIAVGEQSVVADAVQALRQHVRQKAANELVGWQCHGLTAVRPLDVRRQRFWDNGLSKLREALAHQLVISGGLQLVLQAPVGDGLSFDPFSFCQDGATPPAVDVGRGALPSH
jgi:hypothetical protein